MNKINTACVIDDDPIFVFGIKKIMEIINFSDELMIFKNGKEALTNLQEMISQSKQLPDVIFLDINMPILDGWQFLDEFVKIELDKEIMIYIVSSSVDPEDVLKAKSFKSVIDYIVKPVNIEKIQKVYDAI